MRGKSHISLGQYLADRYMTAMPKRHIQAFLLGCIEPDRNPVTYLKGSIRRQWLRGHNWGNSERYMTRLSLRLESRRRLNLLDCYSLGKLIHYTTDAFTSAHNEHFGIDLHKHRTYEEALQNHFLKYLSGCPEIRADARKPVMDTIRSYHREYLCRPVSIQTDTRFTIIVCSMVMTRIFA